MSDPITTEPPEALPLVLLSIHPVPSRPCSAPGVNRDIIRQYAERLLHGFTLYPDDAPDHSLSVFFYLKDQESKWELFTQYCNATMQLLMERLQEPRIAVEFLSTFAQPSIKHLHLTSARLNMEVSNIGRTLQSCRIEWASNLSTVHLALDEIWAVIFSNQCMGGECSCTNR